MLGDFDLLALTAGFIFLGTPFRGSGLASAGQLFASVAAYLGFVTELRILGALGQTSEILEGLRHTFCSWQRTYQIPCFCFHEKLKTLYWSIFGWSIAVMVSSHRCCLMMCRLNNSRSSRRTLLASTVYQEKDYTQTILRLPSTAIRTTPTTSKYATS